MKLHNAKKVNDCKRIEHLLDQLPATGASTTGQLNRYKVKFKIPGVHNKIFSRIVKAATPQDATEEIRLFHGSELRVIKIQRQ